MYADRAKRFSPAGAGAALAVNGALIAGLILAFAPVIIRMPPPPILNTYNVPDTQPPPPEDPVKPKAETPLADPQPYVPPATDPLPSDNKTVGTSTKTDEPPTPGPTAPTGGTEVAKDPPAPPPLIGAVVDPRYASLFQPEYPAIGIRNGTEGVATVRVLIGVDGRVKQIEQVSATIPAFFDATRRQALSRWRFKPATRGGVPQESWKVMTVRFVLSGAE